MNPENIPKFIIALLAAFIPGFLGSLATTPNIPSWYSGLDKPPLIPPNEVFGPVWSVLYLLIGISLYLVIISEKDLPKKPAYMAYAAQLVLNLLWSLVFFGLQMPWLAAVVIVLLIISIIWNIRVSKRFSKIAAYLLIPYFLWVCFATYLNLGVAVLN